MTWVKVCGVRRLEDLAAVEAAGGDAVGFVLAPGTPRHIDPERAATLVRQANLATFIVTVDASPAELLDLAGATGASGVQPHGAGSPEAAAAAERAGLEVLRPVPVRGPVLLGHVPIGQIPLLDNVAPGVLGGTGAPFDHSLIGEVDRPWVLAGGLAPGMVGEVVRRLRPWGVDASSRLESAAGVKDPELIRRFVWEAKSA